MTLVLKMKKISLIVDKSYDQGNNSTRNNFNMPSANKESNQVTESIQKSKVNQEENTNTAGNTEVPNTISFSPFPFSKARQLSINKTPALLKM